MKRRPDDALRMHLPPSYAIKAARRYFWWYRRQQIMGTIFVGSVLIWRWANA